MKVCPYCAGDIQDEAVVCRYCHSDLPPFRASSGKRRCPYCAEWISASLTTCDQCQREISLDPDAGFFEPSSEPDLEARAHEQEPEPVAPVAYPAPPPPSQPASLRDILSSLDAHQQATDEIEAAPEADEFFEPEPSAGGEAEWRSHKTPPFSILPAEEESLAMGDWGQESESPFGSDSLPWEDERSDAQDRDAEPRGQDEASAPMADSAGWRETRAASSNRDSGIFRQELGQSSGSDSGAGRRTEGMGSSSDSGSWRRREESGLYDSGSWRRAQDTPPSQPGSRSINYISQSALRRSAIAERLAELDSTAARQRVPVNSTPEGSRIHPGAFLVVAIAILSVALVYFLGPGRGMISSFLATSTPADVAGPGVQPTPTSLPTALQPLIKDTSAPTPSASAASGECLSWDQVTADDAGKELCVEGTVKRWFATQDFPMVVIFSEEPATFIFVDAEDAPSVVRPGTCVSATGQVKIMGGERPYIELVDPPLVCAEGQSP